MVVQNSGSAQSFDFCEFVGNNVQGDGVINIADGITTIYNSTFDSSIQ